MSCTINSNHHRLRICIIGAGAAGLVNIKYLKEREDVFDITVYEKGRQIGGTWVYDHQVGFDEDGNRIHSSMYKYLVTNLPMCIMQFQDFPCHDNKSAFIRHEDVLDYLNCYTRHFELEKCIKFRHEVRCVKRLGDKNVWSVRICNLDSKEVFVKEFDNVLVCNGKYSLPLIPSLFAPSNCNQFKGKVIHAHDYRDPQDFQNQRVAVIGAGPSGIDIALELAEVAKQVYLIHSRPALPGLEGTISQINCRVESLDEDLVLDDGHRLQDIDTIMLATGYEYDLNFLDDSCKIVMKDNRVTDLYLHLVNISYPSMAIWGVPFKVNPFPLSEQQVKFYMKYLLKEFDLPSKESMLREQEEDMQSRLKEGIPARHAHRMTTAAMHFEYEDRLQQLSGITSIKPVIRSLYAQLEGFRKNYPLEYKSWKFQILNDQEFKTIK